MTPEAVRSLEAAERHMTTLSEVSDTYRHMEWLVAQVRDLDHQLNEAKASGMSWLREYESLRALARSARIRLSKVQDDTVRSAIEDLPT